MSKINLLTAKPMTLVLIRPNRTGGMIDLGELTPSRRLRRPLPRSPKRPLSSVPQTCRILLPHRSRPGLSPDDKRQLRSFATLNGLGPARMLMARKAAAKRSDLDARAREVYAHAVAYAGKRKVSLSDAFAAIALASRASRASRSNRARSRGRRPPMMTRPLSRSRKAVELRRRGHRRAGRIDELASEWRGSVGEDRWEDVIEEVKALASLDAGFQRITGTRRTPIRDMVRAYALYAAEEAADEVANGPRFLASGAPDKPPPLPTEDVLAYIFGPPGGPARAPLDAALVGRRALSRHANRPRKEL
jgi:hypothetical protein